MPRKKFWKRGATRKKGDSHPSNKGLTIDIDQVKPPVKKVMDDQVKPPVKKVMDDQVKPPAKKKVIYQNIARESARNIARKSARNFARKSDGNLTRKSVETSAITLSCQNQTENDVSLIGMNTSDCHNGIKTYVQKKNGGEKTLDGIAHSPISTTFASHNQSDNRYSLFSRGSQSLINDTVFASHNQTDLRYSMLSRGNQCTCMSLSVVVAMQENDQLSTSFLDQVLYEGDNLYKKVVMDLKREGKYVNALLSFNELPSALEYRDKYYSVNHHSSIYGVSIVENNTETLSLHEGIIFGLTKSQHLLIMYGALCSAIMFIDGNYLFFDSHSHGDDGLSAPDGKSMLKVFSSIDNLIAFLYSFYTSCNIDLQSQFEILPVVVHLIQHDFLQEQMTSYENGQAESRGSKSNERNCQSGNKNREQYTDIERQRNLHVDRKLKANTRYREKELLGKRKVIDDDTFYDKDVADKRKKYMRDYMQKRRKCSKFKLQEARAKKEARSENEYRQNERERELSAKRKSRKDQEYKKKELTEKRKKSR